MLTTDNTPRYASPAAAKSVAGFGDPNSQRRTSAPLTGAFFVSVSYGGCAWETFGSAGFLCDRFANPRTVAPIFLARDMGDSKYKGVSTMAKLRLFLTRTTASRAAAHRAMAKAALFADSSTKTRLRRYNHHAEKARTLEDQLRERRQYCFMHAHNITIRQLPNGQFEADRYLSNEDATVTYRGASRAQAIGKALRHASLIEAQEVTS